MLIAIEGIDGSGKGTQARLLKERLLSDGCPVTLLSFPQYEQTFFGREVGRYLDGSFGPLDAVHPKFSSLLYALDRFEMAPIIDKAIKRGDIVICDRYIGSNIAHQCARVANGGFSEMAGWIQEVEEGILKIRKADKTIFLDVNVDQARALVASKETRTYTEKTHDLHEASEDHLAKALTNFRRLAQMENWIRIVCDQLNGKIRAPTDIAEEVYCRLHQNDVKT